MRSDLVRNSPNESSEMVSAKGVVTGFRTAEHGDGCTWELASSQPCAEILRSRGLKRILGFISLFLVGGFALNAAAGKRRKREVCNQFGILELLPPDFFRYIVNKLDRQDLFRLAETSSSMNKKLWRMPNTLLFPRDFIEKTTIDDRHEAPEIFSDDSVKIYTSILLKAPLTKICVMRKKKFISDEGLKALFAVFAKTKLTELCLRGSEIGDEGLKALAAVIAQTQITKLDLGCNRIGDEGLKALAAVIAQTQITALILDNNMVGDEGLKALAAVIAQTQIENIYLADNNRLSSMARHAFLEAFSQKQKASWVYIFGDGCCIM